MFASKVSVCMQVLSPATAICLTSDREKIMTRAVCTFVYNRSCIAYLLAIAFSQRALLESGLVDCHRCHFTLENHCTRTAQSSRGGCSRQVHTIEYIAVEKGTILVKIYLLKIFIANYCHL